LVAQHKKELEEERKREEERKAAGLPPETNSKSNSRIGSPAPIPESTKVDHDDNVCFYIF